MINIHDFWAKRQPKVVYSYIPEPTYRQKDPPELQRMAIEAIANWDVSGANCPPVFMPDFGTVTTAKPFGGNVVRSSDGEQIFIEHAAATIDEALAIEPTPNADVDQAVAIYRDVCRQTGRNDIRFVTPDFQGPLNTAAQIVKQDEFLIALYTEPRKVHEFLARVTDTLVEFLRRLMAQVRVDGGCWPYMWIPQEIGVVVTEDLMPLLSPELYKEFGLPYLKRISDEFGGVFVHSCGQWTHNAKVLAASGVKLLGLDFCYPYATIEEIQETLPGLVLQPGFEFFKSVEYPDFPSYVEGMITNRRGDTCLWFAMNSHPIWQFDRVRNILEKHGAADVTFGW
ncbi:MAG: hypothetical protein FWE88_05160 [Phycisphaerae bacterium]|nr:hypothetical protein [Phycisphaerae bacterium]